MRKVTAVLAVISMAVTSMGAPHPSAKPVVIENIHFGAVALSLSNGQHTDPPTISTLSAFEKQQLDVQFKQRLALPDAEIRHNAGTLKVNFTPSRSGKVKVILYSADGTIAFKEKYKEAASKINVAIGLKDAVNPVYFLIIEQDGRTWSRKIML